MSAPVAKGARRTMYSFRVDEALVEIVARLEAAAVERGALPSKARSVAIRKALIEADERLSSGRGRKRGG